MVKIGFIVEGATEKIILERSDFFNHLESLNIAYTPIVVDAKGNSNLLPHNLAAHTDALKSEGATHIFILTDLDDEKCITRTKQRISASADHIVIVSVKVIEAWFLADTEAMRSYLNDVAFEYPDPEKANNPYEEIRALRVSRLGRGITSKLVLANSIIKNNNFSILRAAEHPNCHSARYFLGKVSEFAGK